MSRGRLQGGAIAALLLLGLRCGRSPERPVASARAADSAATPSASRPAVETADVESRTHRPAGARPPIIWLGLDGLDWELLDRLAAEGRMPNWKRLTEQGYTAVLRSFVPILSPVVWTSIATGVGPDVHRVLDFQEVEPATGQKVPISGRSRAVPAIWNVATASGLSVGVVGWWATDPAEEVKGFFVSDHASPILFQGAPRGGVAYPTSLAAGVEQVVAQDGRVSNAELERFLDVPPAEIAEVRAGGAGFDHPIVALACIIGATRVNQRIARDLYDRDLPDLMTVYFEGTDGIGHVFASYEPPKMDCVAEADFARYHRAVDEYYSLVDRLIGQWMRRADEDGATLIVNSDHGFKWGADRSCERGSLNPATAGFWHRIHGVFAAYGARVRRGAARGAATVFDVAPTVAALAGLPVDRRLRGGVLRDGFSQISTPPRRDLFGTVSVRRVQSAGLSEKDASEYARRLKALGYLSGGEPEKLAPLGGDRPGLSEGGWNNLGLYLRENSKDLAGAEAAFRKALALRPGYASPQFNLAVLHRMRGEDAQAIDWLFRSIESGHADPQGTIRTWASEYEEKGKGARALEVLERGSRRYADSEPIGRDLGLAYFRARDCRRAEGALGRFEAASRSPETLNAIALVRTCLGRREEAINLLQRSLSIKPDQPGVVRSLNLLQQGLLPGQ